MPILAGAEVCDDGDLSRVSIRLAGHELSREGKFSDPSAVSAIDNVEILDGHDFVDPIAPTPQRVNFREAVLSAAESSSPALTEKLYRSMNLVDPPTGYSPLLT